MSKAPSTGVRVVDFGPDRTSFRPGSQASVSVTLASPGGTVDARLEVLDGASLVDSIEKRLKLTTGSSVRRFSFDVPNVGRHGYGLRLQLESRIGRAEANSAFEALDGWWESPRHVALTEFVPGSRAVQVAQRLRRWHFNVAQFYDWMYRHYRYLPPGKQTVFEDALGRLVSHAVVKQLIRECRKSGIASLAYGSVYGAEREYVERRPSELLRDAAGRPLSLGETFFITDLRPGSPWRRRLMKEYVGACRALGFDGVHMDQYGEPHDGFAADGVRVRLDELFAGLVDEAARRLGSLLPPRRVLFNCVGGWPLEQVACSATVATYIEIWPPDVTYRNLVAQVEKARSLAPAKQVVIAAYPQVAADDGQGARPSRQASEAALLLSSVVFAAGAYHHAIAEEDRVLVGGYYPDAAQLPAEAAEALRLAWEFSARYVHLLSDTTSEPVASDGIRIEAGGAALPLAPEPEAGTVWVRPVKTRDDKVVVQLVDLLDQASDEWDAPKRPSARRHGWRFSWPGYDQRWFCASPWSDGGLAVRLPQAIPGPIPSFERWAMLVGETT